MVPFWAFEVKDSFWLQKVINSYITQIPNQTTSGLAVLMVQPKPYWERKNLNEILWVGLIRLILTYPWCVLEGNNYFSSSFTIKQCEIYQFI